MSKIRDRPLWTCPKCGAKLVTYLDDEVQAWLRESYRLMGMQQRLEE